jgi:predicted phosphodiesterase
MDINKHNCTRRKFLQVATAGTATIALSSCLSGSETLVENRPFTFVQICDTQLGFGGYEQDVIAFKQAVKQVNALKPEFVVICGDLVNTPNDKSFTDFNAVKAGFKLPCYCVSGNHDIGNQPTPASLQTYRRVIGKDYYSFEHRGHSVVVVNTSLWKTRVTDESEKQDAWLKNTLNVAASKHTPVFVVGHHPLFIKEPDEKEEYYNLPPATRKALLSLFEKSGVVAILGGHTHKLLINEYKGIQLLNAESTSKNFDKRPLGFRLGHVGDNRPFKHEFVPLENL